MVRDTYFSPSYTKQLFQNINKHELNSKQVPCKLVTHASFKLVSRLKQQHSDIILNSLDIKCISKLCKSSPVSYFCWTRRSAGEQVLTGHVWNAPEQTVQDKKFPEVAGNTAIISVHTDKYLDLEGIILLSQEGGSSWEACSVLKRSNRVTIVGSTCCNSRTLLFQITPLQKCSKANTSLPPNT